jgi:C4-dicarboxylate-specific signal transduction histidine kinase
MDGYDIEDIHKTLRQHLLTRDAIALKSFFTVSSVASLPSILTSSEEVRKKLTRKQRREMRRAARVMRSLKDGAGSLSLMQYRRFIDAAGRPLPL